MSLTNILAISESVGINDQRFVGQMLSRNQRISTSEVLTVVPFEFTMKPMQYLLYSQNRALLNSLRIPDKALEQYLNFAQTGWLNYIQYQGDMTASQIAASNWLSASSGKNLVLGNIPAGVTASEYVVKAGDFYQVGRYAYIATQDVLRGSGSTVTIPVHRTLLTTVSTPIPAVIGEFGTTVSLGGSFYTGVTFCVILKSYPTYTLMPFKDDSYISWAGEFVAMESVT